MDDDFNSPSALAVLFDLSKAVNTLMSADIQPNRVTLETIDALYNELAGEVLGILPGKTDNKVDAKREEGLIQLLIDTRAKARQKKDFDTSDEIRDRMKAIVIILEDCKDRSTWELSQAAEDQ